MDRSVVREGQLVDRSWVRGEQALGKRRTGAEKEMDRSCVRDGPELGKR
jgi:hypothetical protein